MHTKYRKLSTSALNNYFSGQVWFKKSCGIHKTILVLRKNARGSEFGARMITLRRVQASDFAENRCFEQFSLFSDDS